MDVNNTCHGCEKPVYFAERKTSLGKNWHRHCLKCKECGKVVSPGQHAEHKGVPYCHNPCYGALFGPKIIGFGSNITSPANFRKSSELNGSVDASNENNNTDGIKCIFKTTNTSPGPIKFLRSNTEDSTPPKVFQKRHSSSGLETQSDSSSGYSSNSGSSTGLDVVSESSGSSSGLKCVYQSSGASTIKNKRQSAPVLRSHSDAGKFTAMAPRTSNKIRGPELFKKVQSYNEHHDNKRGQNLSILEEDGNVRVQGPLRIYWGLKKPIMLKQYDEVPAIPIPKKRLSVFTDTRELKPLPEITQDRDSTESPPAQRRNLDDSVISSPSSDVVMRRTNIKKSNTVAYRGDRSNKWKRASINGHIYNYDTSVFTPVLGSCTTVTVDNKMTVLQVITTLLEKFKVENEPDEYNLCIITEQEGERTLKATDIPLLERLVLGPSDSVKIFIRDRQEATPTVVNPAHIPDGSSPTTETPPEEIPLPEEVEQLINIPEPVLQGLLDKFRRDEEQEIRRLKNKYERIRKRVREIISDKKATASRC